MFVNKINKTVSKAFKLNKKFCSTTFRHQEEFKYKTNKQNKACTRQSQTVKKVPCTSAETHVGNKALYLTLDI